MSYGFNFARVPFTNERLPWLGFVLGVIAVGALTVAHGVILTRYLLREQEELDIRVEELRDQIRETDDAIKEARQALERDQSALANEKTRFLVQLYRRKSFSWTGLFNELETITPASVRITSVTPVEREGRIRVTLTVVGRTLQDLLAMVGSLESSSFFRTVFPLDEANLDVRQGGEPGIAATLELEYIEPSLRAAAGESP
ncbi:MAG TPA: hypothetical protein VEK15_09455 [Vicinamibacteria bacterium]|nr:hypothetical protein [Vicinamibacteria bacterium]